MLRNLVQKAFDIREGEYQVSFLMTGYIFLVIAVLLIIKPTVNALFLSDLGVRQLPIAFLLVAFTAVLSSFAYSRALTKFPLKKIIEVTLTASIFILIGLGVLLKLNLVNGWTLYFFYVWVAIYAVLSASQFWVLANMVFNIREAKRLFSFIGSGAILGGIFGGYLTSVLAPFVESEILLFLAACILFCCIPLLRTIWKLRVIKLNAFRQKKRMATHSERPFSLIKRSRHLSYIALIVAVSVVVAKLVDYLFSDFASAAITDPEELTSFFGFWFSNFNLASLGIQLFFTHRIVGIWGVGFSLVLLPVGILLSCLLFLVFPELAIVVLIKAMDGVLKQSVHKSATELLALPLAFEIKHKTKSFIDVVVDSIATGFAGFLLIFVVRGLELPSAYIIGLVMLLVVLWGYFIFQVRTEYFKTFRYNLEAVTEKSNRATKPTIKKASVVQGMRSVFKSGTEEQILFMLQKLMEINDKRFLDDVQSLLGHPSTKVRTAAIQNLYYLNPKTMASKVPDLLATEDDDLTLATLEYILLHAGKKSEMIYDAYLNHQNTHIANVALYCLAREIRDNVSLKTTYDLQGRIQAKIEASATPEFSKKDVRLLLRIIGFSNINSFYPFITKHLKSNDEATVLTAIESAGVSASDVFVSDLISFLSQKHYRETTIAALQHYGVKMLSVLTITVIDRLKPLETCRFVPMALRAFDSQLAVDWLFQLLRDTDLRIRLEVVRVLSDLRKSRPELNFDKYAVVDLILEECKMYHMTLSAMHSQIIISYRNRKKSNKEISPEERDARTSLLEVLERRLDAGLERIFRLLGLKYQVKDIEMAYHGLLSDKQEARTNAIEFLDNLLTGNLKRTLLPIIEESVLDIASEEVLQKIKHKIPTELECFQFLLQGNDLKLKLAVLYLIQQQKEEKYVPIVAPYIKSDDLKLRTFAIEAIQALSPIH